MTPRNPITGIAGCCARAASGWLGRQGHFWSVTWQKSGDLTRLLRTPSIGRPSLVLGDLQGPAGHSWYVMMLVTGRSQIACFDTRRPEFLTRSGAPVALLARHSRSSAELTMVW